MNPTDATSPQEKLARMVEDASIVVCVGSGGVGKTTIAATVGLYAALVGKRTLVMTIDPAKRLADALGLDTLSHKPRAVSHTLLREARVEGAATLDAMMLDLTEAWDDLIIRIFSADDAARVKQNRFYRHLSRDLPGAQEFIACEALGHIVDEGKYDFVVLDTPPTANALDFLNAPTRILNLLDNDAFRMFYRGSDSLVGRLGLQFIDGTSLAARAILGKFTGTGFLDEFAGFLSLFRSAFEPLAERTRAVNAVLQGGNSRFLVVTSPQPGPLAEANAFQKLLAERNLDVSGIVVNMVASAPNVSADDDVSIAAVAEAIAARAPPGRDDAHGLEHNVRAALSDGRNTARVHDRSIGSYLENRALDVPFVRIPRLRPDVTDAERFVLLLGNLFGFRHT